MTFVADKSTNNPTDPKYTSATRTAANLAAVVALTPAFAGEIVRALDTGKQFRGTALTAGSWAEVVTDHSP